MVKDDLFFEPLKSCEPINDKFASIYHDWMGFEQQMVSCNDNQDTTEACLYVQFMKTCLAEFGTDEPMSNPFIQ